MFSFLSPFLVLLLGLVGLFFLRSNVILLLMSIELLLFGVNLELVFISLYLDDLVGQVFSLFILTVAGAESAIGLAILVIYYRIRGVVSVDYVSNLKG